jgi:hypothetical protein
MNLNAPLNGGRPDPTLGNIIAAVSDARSRQNTVTVSLSAGAPPPPPFGGAQGPRWDWTRTIVNAFYTLGSTRNNTDAAVGPPIGGPIFFDGFGSPGGASVTNPPPTGNLEDDWGPANNDVRQRLSVGVLSQTLRNLNVGLNVTASSGTPYTIRTGGDDNRDAIFNDRPVGVGRNTLRGASQWSLNLNIGYGLAFGRTAPQAGPAGIGVYVQGAPGGSAPAVTTFTAPPARFRINIFVNAQNLSNHRNYGGYSGTLTSPFFAEPTLVLNPRKVDMGVAFQF